MEQNIYKTYYWQDEKIRLRLWQPNDIDANILIDYDSIGLLLVEKQMPLPPKQRNMMKILSLENRI